MSRPLILMYHRIADAPVDYWGLAVSPARFEVHLSILRRTRHPLPLMEFVDRLVAGTLPPDAVALTFDDGYVDNLDAGLPRLTAADVPATVFLATGFLDRPEPFWWDELASFILLERNLKTFDAVIDGKSMSFELGAETAAAGNDAASIAATKSRPAVLEAIYHSIRRLDEEERGVAMGQLRSIFTARDDRAGLGRPMTGDEVRTLARGGLVTIGAHTVTHPLLPELPGTARDHELMTSKLACEALVGAPVSAFAYPFGVYNVEACESVRRAGFTFACSTGRAPKVDASDLFALRRAFITNLDGDTFGQFLHAA
jgi:peptidoglycan/xylan/chitin deacetylase (PgdA/CDA1 family)